MSIDESFYLVVMIFLLAGMLLLQSFWAKLIGYHVW